MRLLVDELGEPFAEKLGFWGVSRAFNNRPKATKFTDGSLLNESYVKQK
jgi:hypothetical protein